MTTLRAAPGRGRTRKAPVCSGPLQRGQLWRRTRAGIGQDIPPPPSEINRLHHGGVMTFEDRFWAKVSPEPNSGCWLWTGWGNSKGYGRIWQNDRKVLAHCASYEMHKGAIPADLELDHLCRVTWCVNPDHLEAVTHKENCRRGKAGLKTGAMQRAKTHCPQGHPYAGSNLYVDKSGKRSCIKCLRRRTQEWRQRNRQLENAR